MSKLFEVGKEYLARKINPNDNGVSVCSITVRKIEAKDIWGQTCKNVTVDVRNSSKIATPLSVKADDKSEQGTFRINGIRYSLSSKDRVY